MYYIIFIFCFFAINVLKFSYAFDAEMLDKFAYQALSSTEITGSKEISIHSNYYKVENIFREISLEQADFMTEDVEVQISISDTSAPKVFMYGILGKYAPHISYYNCTGFPVSKETVRARVPDTTGAFHTYYDSTVKEVTLPSTVINMKDSKLDLDAKFLQVSFESLCEKPENCKKGSILTIKIRIHYIKVAENLKAISDLIYLDRFELFSSPETKAAHPMKGNLTNQERINKDITSNLPRSAKDSQTIKNILYSGEISEIYSDSILKNMQSQTETILSDNQLVRLRMCDYPIIPYNSRFSSSVVKLPIGAYKMHSFIGQPGDGTKMKVSDDGSQINFGVYNYPFTMQCNRLDLDYRANGFETLENVRMQVSKNQRNHRISVKTFRMVTVGSDEYYGIGTGSDNRVNVHIRDYIKLHNNSPEPREPFDRIPNMHAARTGKVLENVFIKFEGTPKNIRVHDRIGKLYYTDIINETSEKWIKIHPRYNLAGGMEGEFIVEYDTKLDSDLSTEDFSFSHYGPYDVVKDSKQKKEFSLLRVIFDFVEKSILKVSGSYEEFVNDKTKTKSLEDDNKYILAMSAAPFINPPPVIEELEYCIHVPEAAYDIEFDVPFPSTKDAENYKIKRGSEKDDVLVKTAFELNKTNIICTKRDLPTSDIWALNTVKTTYAVDKNAVLNKFNAVFSAWLLVSLIYIMIRLLVSN